MQSATASVDLFPVHFPRTFNLQRLGPYDPTTELDHGCFRKAFFYRDAPVTVEIVRRHTTSDAPGRLEVRTYGDYAEELAQETASGLCQEDGYAQFSTLDTGMQRLHRLLPGLRVIRVPWLYDMTCSAILQQRVRTVDAMREWRKISYRYGAPAPLGLRAFPAAEVLAVVPQFALESIGIDAKRAKTLLRFAREMRFVSLKPGMDFEQLRQMLLRVSGIGPWTTETVLGYGAGDTDAVIPGDLHLPRVVCYALAGEEDGTDERMMELLEPFRGHRFRIIRLITSAGIDLP
jgi:3-methyladenine DNA glycosylase/8-oxoguanine DNA glycosylase